MKNIIFLAPPAAGKGTQSELLVKKYGYKHISTGDLFRNEVSLGTNLGKELKSIMDSGKLICDDITCTLLKNELKKYDTSNFILDGFPRNIEQAKLLNNICDELNIKFDSVIYLEMDPDIAMHRALGRVTCPQCGRGYNKYEDAMKPKIDNICDDCGIELVSRSDDNEESFKKRINTYMENTAPLLQYYQELGIISVVDNSGTPEETFKKIESVIV